MKKIIVIIFLSFSSICMSQTDTDSLINALPSINSSKEKITTNQVIAWALIYKYPDSSLLYLNEALKISHKNNYDSLSAKNYNLIGIVYDIKSEWGKSLIYYDSAFSYATKANDTNIIASIFNNKGLIYWNTNQFEKAVKEYFNSKIIFEKTGNKVGEANCLNNIGLIQSDLGSFEKSLAYHKKSLKIREELKGESGINDSKLNIASLIVHKKWEDSKIAISYLQENEIFYRKTKNNYALGKVYTNIASYFENIKQYDSAIFYINKSVEAYRIIKAKNLVGSSLHNLSLYLSGKGENKKAIKYALEAEKIVEETGSLKLLWKIKAHLGDFYFEKGAYKKAGKKYKESTILKDSVFSIEQQKAISTLELKYQSAKKENEINKQKTIILEQEKEVAKAELNSSEKQKWIYILVGLFVVLVLSVYLLFQRKKKETEKAIQVEKQKGLHAVISSQEKERKRIAKNIHDSTIQQLVSLRFGLVSLDTKNKDPLIKLLDDSTHELRDFSHQLMPKYLEKFGLEKSIDSLLETSLIYTNILYLYDYYGIKERLPKTIEINLYRTIQELIHNVIKHSKASKIDVQLYQLGSNLYLIFEDNGVGFDVSDNTQGIGIQSVISRIKLLNGVINYESLKEKGTTITIKIPIKE